MCMCMCMCMCVCVCMCMYAQVRDLLAFSIALNATMIMPPLVCTCDRYWGFLENCRMPTGPEDMRLPFRCSQAPPPP